MAKSHSVRRGVLGILLTIAFVLQGTTSVLAGTTGSISGVVADPQSNAPVGGARVTAASPSQSSTTTTDASGRYTFASLTPDTYTISVAATASRDATSVSGITVQADQSLTVNLQQPTKLKVIGSVTSRAAAALVKPGTTADVYSINAVAQDKASLGGGGGNLNSAWSAISGIPGVYVVGSQAGYIGAGPTVSIRGGDYDQIGYEFDGVPVNRAFDNYPSGPLSSLGQQELQVYTGAPSANAEANGISGYINQVIRTGTAPASRNLRLEIGTPIQYGKVSFEAGGANPARTFSYYIGAGAYNQSFRYYDQYNGASLQQNWGAPLNNCQNNPQDPGGAGYYTAPGTPGCYSPTGQDYTNGGATPAFVLGPYDLIALSNDQVRDTVANFHFGIPRKDGNRDDVQLLLDVNFINNPGYTSTNDQGGAAFLNRIGVGVPAYYDGYQSSLAPGTLLPPSFTGGNASVYLFPQSPGGRARGFFGNGNNCSLANQSTATGGCIEPDRRDAFVNNQGIGKLQYQRNFGTNAFLRVYGYTYYSDWLQTGPQSSWMNILGYVPGDYELSTHTRGVSAQFTDQISPQHLVTVLGSYTYANVLRDNNTQYLSFGGSGTSFRTVGGILVDSTNPLNGICYAAAGGPGVHAALPTCFNSSGSAYRSGIGSFTYRQQFAGTVTPAAGTCGGGPCQYLVVGNGLYATYNQVVPKFTAFSISDTWKPTDRLSIDLGLRYDRFQYVGADTTHSAARTQNFNAWNLAFPTQQQFNVSGQVNTYSELEPRLGATYTLSPRTVVRAAYGRYAQGPNSAFEQYNYLASQSANLMRNFVRIAGFTTPSHLIRPSVANSFDLSLEHQFNRDTSMKLTPFLRKTQDQIQQFYLDQKTNFVSGVNVGAQTSQGFELEVDKGDFSRNGWAGRLTYTYTNSYIQYSRFNGISVVDSFNKGIANYNTFTQAGGGAPCYTTAGTADPACAATSIANPYYNAPMQPLMDPNGKYAPYSLFPAGITSAPAEAYGAPHVASLTVQYKHGPLAITPALAFSGGVRYGLPLGNQGIVPNTCGPGLTGSTTAGDPRYPYGAPGGLPFDATNCGNVFNPTGTGPNDNVEFAIPNVYTGRFDNIGAFVAPSKLSLHMQVAYDVSKNVTLVGKFANIINTCFGGTKVPWAVSKACDYGNTYGSGSGPEPIGNAFNPGWTIQPFLRAPYDPAFVGFPFNMYFEARIKM